MSKNASYKLIFNRRGKLNSQNKAQIEIRITKDRKSVYIPTNVYLHPDQWNNKTAKINSRHQYSVKFNKGLQDKIYLMQNYEIECRINEINPSLQDIKEFYHNYKNNNNNNSFPDWCSRIVETDNKVSKGTLKHRRSLIKKLKEFNRNLTFNMIDYQFLREFESFLHGFINPVSKEKLKQSTVHSNMKMLKYFLNIAFKEGMISYKPEYSVKTGIVNKEALTEIEVQRIKDLKFVEPGLERVQDLFLFACYTSIRFGDLTLLTKDNIRTTDEGLELFFKQQKVGKAISLPLYKLFNGEPERILKKYAAYKDLTIFEVPTNQYVNRSLKIIRAAAKIEKPLTFHISRHTCLTIIGQKTGNPYLVMKIAGHTNLKTSMTYTSGVVDKGLFDLL